MHKVFHQFNNLLSNYLRPKCYNQCYCNHQRLTQIPPKVRCWPTWGLVEAFQILNHCIYSLILRSQKSSSLIREKQCAAVFICKGGCVSFTWRWGANRSVFRFLQLFRSFCDMRRETKTTTNRSLCYTKFCPFGLRRWIFVFLSDIARPFEFMRTTSSTSISLHFLRLNTRRCLINNTYFKNGKYLLCSNLQIFSCNMTYFRHLFSLSYD